MDVYVFRRPASPPPGEVEILQIRRVPDEVLGGTWQPVMGHMESGEIAAATALRELREETGFAPGRGLVGFWQLELPNTYFLHSHACFVMSPCFAAEVERSAEPVLDAAHDALRWVPRADAERHFIWPGQRGAVEGIVRDIVSSGSAVEPILRIDPASVPGREFGG
ncbi:MAG: NUDIX domain-containing protein [Phycisphaeraceae bacterium]